MSTEFLEFVAGLRRRARAAGGVEHTGNLAWRAGLAAGSRARRLRAIDE
jgi:hypothetical protein